MSLVQALPECAVDIIGDVHGEYQALQALLHRLGYAGSGGHPHGRKLVFTGDLVDRGPDSPAVMDKVIALVEAGVAHCVLGNHELNILRGVRKGGNDWILDAAAGTDPSGHHVVATPGQARKYREFLNNQPFALVGPHLRVVHACWNEGAIAALQQLQKSGMDIGQMYRATEARIVAELATERAAETKLREVQKYSSRIVDPAWSAVVLPGHAAVDMALQLNNPLRMVTTSEEQIVATPFWAAGKWRMTERARWWEQYADEVPVVIGHFWRMFDGDARRITGMFGADVFEGIPSHAWMGLQRNVYCVDYSVGQRHLERREDESEAFHGKLAALRFPEWEVVHDDGTVVAIGAPGGGQVV